MTHLHSPGTLHVPCSRLHPCLQMAFGKGNRKWQVSVSFKSDHFHQHSLHHHFKWFQWESLHGWHFVLQVVKSLQSNFLCFLFVVKCKRVSAALTMDGRVNVGKCKVSTALTSFLTFFEFLQSDTWHEHQWASKCFYEKGQWGGRD